MNKLALWIGVGALLAAVAVGSYFVRRWAVSDRHERGMDFSFHPAESGLSGSDAALQVKEIPVPPPPFSEDIFPCSDCHDPEDEVERERRELTLEHEQIELRHDEANRWCLDCHNAANRDFLHLADGRLVEFTESYRLCGQCHGPTYRDWREGLHGKRTGFWNGEKHYLLCVHCHDPHAPAFKPIHPFPAPVPPQAID